MWWLTYHSVIESIIHHTQDVDEIHGQWYKNALTLPEKIKIAETMPRLIETQLHKSNTPAESVLDYYKRTIRISLLHDLMCELDYSFDSSKTEPIFNGFANFNDLVQQTEKGHWKEKCSIFANFIKDDLPNALLLDSELDLWEAY